MTCYKFRIAILTSVRLQTRLTILQHVCHLDGAVSGWAVGLAAAIQVPLHRELVDLVDVLNHGVFVQAAFDGFRPCRFGVEVTAIR